MEYKLHDRNCFRSLEYSDKNDKHEQFPEVPVTRNGREHMLARKKNKNKTNKIL